MPDSPIQDIPLYGPNKTTLDIGFIEIGCKEHRKRSDLNNKRDLFYTYWRNTYARPGGIRWFPQVFRTLVHYDPSGSLDLRNIQKEIDAIIFYPYFTVAMLDALEDKDKENVFSIVNSEKKKKSLLEEILKDRDAARLHRLIKDETDRYTSTLRGKMAEIMALKDIERSLPRGVNLFCNSDIRYFNKKYRNGTEVDGILTFYGQDRYETLLNTLQERRHIRMTRKNPHTRRTKAYKPV